MRVGVVGAGGRMGRTVCRAVLAADGLELVAAVDPAHVGERIGRGTGAAGGQDGQGSAGGASDAAALTVVADPGALADAGAEVAVDFTRIESARDTLDACASSGVHAVVGTTGFTPSDLDHLAEVFAGPDAGAPNCLVAANFAIGAVLMMRFAELAATWFDGAEIIELHHDGKRDAPSGTAMTTAGRMAAARSAAAAGPFAPDHTTTRVLEGARGGDGPGGVRLHSVRLPGLVAHQEVLLGTSGQGLTLRHDAYDRTSFMDGVLLAVRSVPDRPGLTLGLDALLGI